MFGFQQKIMTQQKKQQKRKCDLYSGEQSSQYKLILSGSDLDLADKNVKAAITNIVKELKVTIFRELKEIMMTILQQTGNLNRERGTIKR